MSKLEIDVIYPLLRRSSHPGAILSEMLEDLPFPYFELPNRLAISDLELGELLAERLTVSSWLAEKLSEHVGGTADLWSRLQAEFDGFAIN